MADQDKSKPVNNSNSADSNDHRNVAEVVRDTSFGIGQWRTNALKGSHHLILFAVLSGLTGMFSYMVRTSLIGQFTKFEVHYNFEPLSISQDLFSRESIGVLLMVFTTGYVANYMPIPLMTGVSGIMFGLGMAAPGFLNYIAPYEPQHPKLSPPLNNYTGPPANPFACNLNPNASHMLPPVYDGKEMFKFVYSSSMLSYGMLSAVRWGPMSYLFFDNNVVQKSKVGIYLAITIVITELSRPFGYLFNKYVDELHVDLEETTTSPKDPSFVTAWWLGPIVFGFLTVAASIPMLFLPANLLSGSKQAEQVKHARFRSVHRSLKLSNHHDDDDRTFMSRGKGMSLWQKTKAYYRGLPRIFTNPLFLTLFIIWGIVVIPAVGLSLVNLQYTIFEYNIGKDEAMEADATTNFIANVLAAVVSACVCSKITRKSHYLEFIMICVFLSFVILPVSFFLGCDDVPIYGVGDGHKYGANTTGQALPCPCDYTPPILTCGSDGKNYLSPCHAGCTAQDQAGFFKDCKNLEANPTNIGIPGLCPGDCHHEFVSFSALYTATTFLYKMTDIPKILLALRLIAPKDRGIAFASLGVSNVISNFVGPLALLKFFNDNCLVSMTEKICTYFNRHDIRMLKTGVEFNTYLFAFVMWFVLSKLNHIADKKIKGKVDGMSNHREMMNVEVVRDENVDSKF